MALSADSYITLDDMSEQLGGQLQASDIASIESKVLSACTAIDLHCGQTFVKSATATARTWEPETILYCRTDPFWTTDGLIIETDTAGDATYTTEWTAADYELDQFGGTMRYLMSSPYDKIRAVGSLRFPTGTRKWTVQVTAKWGWAAVPQNVVESARLLAVDLWKLPPFGITQNLAEFGALRVRKDVVDNVSDLLASFVRKERTVGIA